MQKIKLAAKERIFVENILNVYVLHSEYFYYKELF